MAAKVLRVGPVERTPEAVVPYLSLAGIENVSRLVSKRASGDPYEPMIELILGENPDIIIFDGVHAAARERAVEDPALVGMLLYATVREVTTRVRGRRELRERVDQGAVVTAVNLIR